MRYVIWEDKNGYKHRSMIRDNDPESAAPQGLPADPPNVDKLNWDEVKKAVHNGLVENGLFTWNDVVAKQPALITVVTSAVKRQLIQSYRLAELAEKERQAANK